MRRKLLLMLVPLLLFLAVDQILLRTVLSDDVVFGRRIAPFHPPVFTPAQDAHARALRDGSALPPTNVRFDAQLGWTTRESFAGEREAYDARGARVGSAPVPAARTPGVRRIATFGCSFTHGDEVGNEDAWPAVLDAMRADVEVENFGVGGYGIDQAFLRYAQLASAGLDVDEVWLGFMPRAALRVLSMYRPAQTHEDLSIALKPRLGFENGVPRSTGLPVASTQELGAFVLASDDRFVRALEHTDAFVGRIAAAYEPLGASLWHRSFAARLLLTKLEARGRSNEDALRDPASECFRELLAIVDAFHSAVTTHGERFRVVLLPDRPTLDEWKTAQARDELAAYETFIAAVRERGIEAVDVVDALAVADVAGAGLFAKRGHWTAHGNRVVAQRLAEFVH